MSEFHLFPFGKVSKDSRIIIWGAGLVGHQYYEQLLKSDFCASFCVVDINYSEMKDYIFSVYNPEIIKQGDYEFIIVAQSKNIIAEDIINVLLGWGVKEQQIVWDDVEMETLGGTTVLEKRLHNLELKISSLQKQTGSMENHLKRIEEKNNKQTVNIENDIKTAKQGIMDHVDNSRNVLLRRLNQNKILNIIISIESMLANRIYGQTIYSGRELDYYKQFFSLMHVVKVKNYQLTRIGNENGDGGYVLVDDLRDRVNKVAYSFGISDDVSWDKGMANLGYDIFMYDHTIEVLPEENTHFHFYKKGIADCLEEVGEIYDTLDHYLEQNGHKDMSGIILKMDVEGAEYGFLEMISVSLLDKFDQVIIEFHNLLDVESHQRVITSLKKILATHIPIHVHINNHNVIRFIGNAMLGNTMEITFANRNKYHFEEGNNSFLADVGNFAKRVDFNLQDWNRFNND